MTSTIDTKNVVCSSCESEIQLEDGTDVIVHKSIASAMGWALRLRRRLLPLKS